MIINRTNQSAENHKKECHQFWLRLRHAMILISNFQIPASVKMNWMAWTRTLTVLTVAFKGTKEKFYGFGRLKYARILGNSFGMNKYIFQHLQAYGFTGNISVHSFKNSKEWSQDDEIFTPKFHFNSVEQLKNWSSHSILNNIVRNCL